MPFPLTDNANGIIQSVKLFDGQGFGLENPEALEAKKPFAIRVSDEIDYCISFWLKQSNNNPMLELSATTYSCDFLTQRFTKSITDGIEENFFVRGDEKIISNYQRYHFVRYILYSKNQQQNSSQPLNSMGSGRNLIMAEKTSNLFINLKCVAEPDEYMNIWNFKVRPLRTPFSTGFLNTTNFLEIWRKNNKRHLTNEEVDNIARNYLLPYNSIQAVINL